MLTQEDTIAAIATPIGIGGLSVVRLSGKDAIHICERIFRGQKPLSKMKGYTAQYGKIIDLQGNDIDEVVVTIFTSPHSYTTENMVEISCHGGMFITQQILNAVLNAGARIAQPGEFTKRAFLNGRIDLAQAEAIADLIQSSSELSHRASLLQLEGKLSLEIKKLKEMLIDLCSILELELDFVEEGIEFQNREEVGRKINLVLNEVKKLIDSYNVGKLYREGIRVVIVGKPNVGKSSILNNLLNENRAIVTEIPGTTRDVIEENINLNGILYKVVDTAGFRETIDPIESEGVIRAKNQLKMADLILIVLDHTQGFNNNDIEIIQLVKEYHNPRNIIYVINKTDISINKMVYEKIKEICNETISISAKTGIGMKELKEKLVKIVTHGKVPLTSDGIIVINSRHKEGLLKAKHNLLNALKSYGNKMSNEFIVVDLRAAMDALGEILGEITSDEILNNIFSKFCIGK